MLRTLFTPRLGLLSQARLTTTLQPARLYSNGEGDLTEEEEVETYEYETVNGKRLRKNNHGQFIVTMFEGDGIGPEISRSVRKIFKAA